MISRVLQEGIERLAQAGVPEPEISAEALLECVTRKKRWQFPLDAPLDPAELQAYSVLIEKRATRFPLQYLLGTVAFHEIELEVGEGCLIPRPETEILVEAALRYLPQESPIHLLDVGTGSGNIAISLARTRPHWRITATDFSEAALRFARQNVAKAGFETQIRLIQADLWPKDLEKADAIVSNPPYVPTGDLGAQAELGFEPQSALDGGPTGLAVYERILTRSADLLVDKGMIIFEIGMGQRQGITHLAEQNGFKLLHIMSDYSGIERVFVAQRD